MAPILKIFYTIFLGLLLALFIGMGIAAYYPAPKSPEYPSILNKVDKIETTEQREAQDKYDADTKVFQKDFSNYNRNVFIIALIASIIVLVVSLIFSSFLKELADGVLLGGVFTLIYAIIRAIMSEDMRFRFTAVSVGLLIAIILGYYKLIYKHSSKPVK